jgi:TonB family protein
MAAHKSSISVIALLIFANSVLAQQPKYSPTPPIIQIPPNAKRAKAIALFAPKPEYSEYARKHHWTGVGWFAMHVNVETGVVTSVEITQSTGHKMLDDACVNALKRWRFKPGASAPKVKTPITFTQSIEGQKGAN